MKTCTDISMSGCHVGGYITVTCEDRQRLEEELEKTKVYLDDARDQRDKVIREKLCLEQKYAEAMKELSAFRLGYGSISSPGGFQQIDINQLKQELESARFALRHANDVNRSQADEIEKLKKELEAFRSDGCCPILSEVTRHRDYFKAEAELLNTFANELKGERDLAVASYRISKAENDRLLTWLKCMPATVRDSLSPKSK